MHGDEFVCLFIEFQGASITHVILRPFWGWMRMGISAATKVKNCGDVSSKHNNVCHTDRLSPSFVEPNPNGTI